jgi:hypothetical protein
MDIPAHIHDADGSPTTLRSHTSRMVSTCKTCTRFCSKEHSDQYTLGQSGWMSKSATQPHPQDYVGSVSRSSVVVHDTNRFVWRLHDHDPDVYPRFQSLRLYGSDI